MTTWIEALAALAAEGRAAVVVTVVRALGSTPREAGAKMVVWDGGLSGTIGGGHLELEALAVARELLVGQGGPPPPSAGEDVRAAPAADPGPVLREFALGPSLGQCCGGATTLLFERHAPPAWQVAVFGAGHVGKALVALLAELPCRVQWIDAREGEFPAAPGRNVSVVVDDHPADAAAELPAGTDAVVMTHSHALDLEIVEALLRRDDPGYVGLIGSRTKREKFLRRLAERLPPERLARLTCPIGVAGIRSKLPAAIAIAVAAELLQRRGGGPADTHGGKPRP